MPTSADICPLLWRRTLTGAAGLNCEEAVPFHRMMLKYFAQDCARNFCDIPNLNSIAPA